MEWYKKAGIGAGVALVAYGIYKMGIVKTFSEQVDTSINARVHSIDFSKVVIAVDLKIKNPTQTAITIIQPSVSIAYKGERLASSTPSDKLIRIKPFSESPSVSIMIPLAFTSMVGIGIELIKQLSNKSRTKLPIEIKPFLYMVSGLREPIKDRLSEYAKNEYRLISYSPAPITLNI